MKISANILVGASILGLAGFSALLGYELRELRREVTESAFNSVGGRLEERQKLTTWIRVGEHRQALEFLQHRRDLEVLRFHNLKLFYERYPDLLDRSEVAMHAEARAQRQPFELNPRYASITNQVTEVLDGYR